MEFSVKDITETTKRDEEGETVKYSTKAVSTGEIEVEIVIKEPGECSYEIGDRIEVKKVQSQTRLPVRTEPEKRGPGRPKKGE